MILDNLNIFGGFAGIGVLAAGFGFAYAQFKSGGGRAKDELIATLKETAIVEREKAFRLAQEKETLIRSHQEQLNELNKQMGVLQGTLAATDKKLKEYMDILQGKSPEETKFMEFMTKVAQESGQYMKESSTILKNIQGSLQKIDGRISNSEKAIIKINKGVTK